VKYLEREIGNMVKSYMVMIKFKEGND